MNFKIIVCLVATLIISAILTPFIRMLAFKIGAEDMPNKRRMNNIPMPTIGGLAIFIAYTCATTIMMYNEMSPQKLWGIFAGEVIIIVTGMTDDIYVLKPHQKIIGISLAALFVYFFAQVKMDWITLPFLHFYLGWMSLPLTIIWILAITNAVNLIDGLDGLATGIAIIALSTMGIVGIFFLGSASLPVMIMIFSLVASCIGFLPYNFHPARIYLGDTGSLFIGFMLSVFSLNGLKDVTFISTIIPLVILGVPITDTICAIIRRICHHKPIAHADKMHLHHRLLQLGLTQRQTVLVIYGLALVFAFIALLYPVSSKWGLILLTIATLFGLELFIESIDLTDTHRRPLLHAISNLVQKTTGKNSNNMKGK